jgi:hypothetical protein
LRRTRCRHWSTTSTEPPVDERLKPLLRCVHTLLLTPSRITPADVQALFDAGWDQRALHDAVSLCGLFNLMNRLVDGRGVTADADYLKIAADRLTSIGYARLNDLI